MSAQPALDYAPAELRQHGYRDAHTFPLVSPDIDKVRRSWRVPAQQAWRFPRIELRTGNSWPCISLDCDGRDSVGRLSEFILDENLPTPNVIVQRVASGNVHAHFMLATPVHRGGDARAKPLRALARIAEYLSVTLRADRGYNGVLTLNPTWDGPEFQTSYLRSWPWELRELGEIVPDGWRIPRVPVTIIGRNVSLFRWAVKEAHRPRVAEKLSVYGRNDCHFWEEIVAAKNVDAFGSEAMPAVEVRRIAQSSARYSLRQYDWEKFRDIQRARARKPRQQARKVDRERVAELLAAGHSQRKVAALIGCDRRTVDRIVGGGALTITGSSPRAARPEYRPGDVGAPAAGDRHSEGVA